MELKTFHRLSKSLLVVSLVFVIAVVCITGCGSDVGKAKEYMKKGDEIVTAVEPKAQELKHEFQFFSVSELRVASVDNARAIAARRELMDKTKPLFAEVQIGTKKAKSEYEKIKKLKGVPDYVEYADMQIVIIDMGNELMTKIIGFVNDTIDKLSDGSYNCEDYISESQAVNVDAEMLIMEIRKLYDDARDFKNSKRL